MSAKLNPLSPNKIKKIALIAANKAVSQQTGWPIGFWWAELTHPYWAFTEKGYQVDIYSPDGGQLEADAYSDPEDTSGYSAHDLISMGFKKSPAHAALLTNTRPISAIDPATYDAIFLSGGQSPMYTFVNNTELHQLILKFYEQEKIVAIVCHATCVLLHIKTADGKLLVDGKTWTGFADSEEKFADDYTGIKIQPFWIESAARQLPDTNFIVAGAFTPFAIRDGRLITGQQQFSGAAAAQLLIQALGE
ncbi:type 1 glutamine amidotransferase domain-containing protein [Taibaiella koreensis]|uniref:type 1 glutamine amidotransferase domain-containing protein n=1 Tax=Taibaiella koreensis TaxID=1268548 RepID=UPI000E5997F4|nr:type 1 glutamine amidotransferase domain-containing protein [Taibaiella koreensis]